MDDQPPACFFARANQSRTQAVRRFLAIGAIVLIAVSVPFVPNATARLFDDPQPPAVVDEVVLISTRGVGVSCNPRKLESGLRCERFAPGTAGAKWSSLSWQSVAGEIQPGRSTVVYVHGNRIAPGEDRRRGLMIYESLVRHRQSNEPVRLIIWSWPATQIRGPVKDYHLKAARTLPSGWQLAWFLDQMPEQTPVSIIGYSFGARVVSGALHLLGGGNLDGFRYHPAARDNRKAYRVALIAAAYDADWIQPHNYYGRSLAKTDHLWVLTNRLDPAMRFYNLSTSRGRIPALGWVGVEQPQALGRWASRVHLVDVTAEVGRSHDLTEYLAASDGMGYVWRALTRVNNSSVAGSAKPQAAARLRLSKTRHHSPRPKVMPY